MREEISAAVVFLTRLVQQSGSVSSEKVVEFSDSLSAILIERFQNHWYQDHPAKGQGYRCIRINSFEPIDPVLERAVKDSGLHYTDLHLPHELTLWVDPHDVCCRLGESRGSFCTLATTKDGSLENRAHTINIEELLRQETERHNQQVNIVTTRSNLNVSEPKFTKGLHYGTNTNFYSKYQNNFYNNQQFQNTHNRFRPRNKNQKMQQQEEQVNGKRQSPEHVNEVRQQFMEQVNSAMKDAGEKPHQPKPVSTATSSKSTTKETENSPKTTQKSGAESSIATAVTNNNSKSHTAEVKSSNNTASKSYQAKNKNNSDLSGNTSFKPGSYNGGKNSQWFNRSNGRYHSQKVY